MAQYYTVKAGTTALVLRRTIPLYLGSMTGATVSINFKNVATNAVTTYAGRLVVIGTKRYAEYQIVAANSATVGKFAFEFYGTRADGNLFYLPTRGTDIFEVTARIDGGTPVVTIPGVIINPSIPAPTVTAIGIADQTWRRGNAITSLDVSASFAGTGLVYSMSAIPGLVINSATGIISGTPTTLAAAFSTTVTATNGGGFVSRAFTATVADVPSAMIAPSGFGASTTAISITRGPAPIANNSPITSYDARYSTDGATWTTITGAANPQAVTGLAVATTYQVQQGAVNGIGAGPWSASGYISTLAASAAPTFTQLTVADNLITYALSSAGTVKWSVDDVATPTDAQINAGTAAYAFGSFNSAAGVNDNALNFTGVALGARKLHLTTTIVGGSVYSTPRHFDINVTGVDTTAPVLTLPTGTQTGATTGVGTVTTNEANGTVYLVASTSATAPTATQVIAGQMHTGAAAAANKNQPVTTTGLQTLPMLTGLTTGVPYYNHFTQADAAGNKSTVVSSAAFTPTTVEGNPELMPDVGFDDASKWLLNTGFTVTGSQMVISGAGAFSTAYVYPLGISPAVSAGIALTMILQVASVTTAARFRIYSEEYDAANAYLRTNIFYDTNSDGTLTTGTKTKSYTPGASCTRAQIYIMAYDATLSCALSSLSLKVT